MGQIRVILGILVFFSGQFGFVSTKSPNVCKTFGSGIMQTFNATMFHVKSTCPITMTHFSHAGVDCFISVQRDSNGFMKRVEILVNKIETIIQDGIATVDGNRISLPYDHTYQSVYTFGIYTRLTSKVLPLSVTWYSLPNGVTSLWVQLDRPLVDGMKGMCGGINSSESQVQLLGSNVINDGKCVTGDSQSEPDKTCTEFKSYARECLGKINNFDQLCKPNMNINVHASVKCSFYEEFIRPCNSSYTFLTKLRNMTSCKEHQCPRELQYKDQGVAFPPTCSNPELKTEFRTATCLPPNGLVLNDRVDGYHSVKVENCPCVQRGIIYAPGQKRSSKCQTCECIKGKWICSPNTCVTPCVIEGWFVTTFNGKQYSLPGECTYVAATGHNWTVTIKFSDKTIDETYLDVYKERYIFSLNSVKLREKKITAVDLSQTEHVTVFWQSSMFVKVQTSFGLKMQVQLSPEVQVYLYLQQNVTTSGLCGSNTNTKDDFTTSSGIVENSAQLFALSWTIENCTSKIPYLCVNTDNEIFAEDKCSQLTNTSGVFAQCHDYVSANTYYRACVQRTCQATSNLREQVCVGLGNYAKACASQGIIIGDWRGDTDCTYSCDGNLRFDYAMQSCNQTCRVLSGSDPTCDMLNDPVEGCGCPSGTHLNTPSKCSHRALCDCTYAGGTAPPGPVVIDGRQCICENGVLRCSDACACPHGQICVHCAQTPVNTLHRTCASLSKPSSSDVSCISGCYCPEGQFADHIGSCVSEEKCTCEFSGIVYASGKNVVSNCKTCTCRGGQWNCTGDPCPGVCEVFGNGQYKTFDSNWYRFDGHCQYTLVEDINGRFSINAASVPCCDEVLTCSRSISVKLKDEVTLILADMNVTQKLIDGGRFTAQPLYSVHTVGLYIIISVPQLGLNVIWDKQTKVKIELQAYWTGKVRGLCGDFDGKLMNDLLTSSSTVVFSTLEFGNSWKTAVPPCSDVTQELFPCERHSYCAAWAQRRCMILHSDTFKDCHLKVDPTPYYQACVLESCSCDFEGKFLGFCTVVAAYADACTSQNVCIKWRTPDLCPVYCDYYNEEGQYSWHYEACPRQIKTCGKNHKFSGKLEGCYPQCPSQMPYYDENRRICSSLDNCTCYFNNTVLKPGAKVTTPSECCECNEGQMICEVCVPPTIHTSPATSPTNKTPFTTTTTQLNIIIGNSSTSPNPESQKLNSTTTTPGTNTTKTTEEPTTPTTKTTVIVITSTAQNITQIPTTTTSTPEITTEELTSTTPLTTTTQTTTTSTPEITTEELTSTTPLTTTQTPTTTTSTTVITTEELTSTTPLTTTTQTTTTSTLEITTEELTSTTPLTTTTQTPTTTTSTTEITTEELSSTTPLTTTQTPTTTTSTAEITTEEHTSTTPLTSTIQTTASTTSTTEITTEELTSTTPLTTTTQTTTTSTPEITTEELSSTTPLTTATQTTATTSTTEITTEELASTTPLTTTQTPTTTTSTAEITTEEHTSTTPLTSTIQTTASTTSTTEITTEELTSTTPLTTTTQTTTTSTPEITTEELSSTTPLTTATQTTTATTSITEITTEELTSTTPLTTTQTPTTTTSTTEITTEELTSTTPLTTTTQTTTASTLEITTEELTSTTPLTTTQIQTTTTSTTEITTEEHRSTTPQSITTTMTATTASTPESTTEKLTSTTILQMDCKDLSRNQTWPDGFEWTEDCFNKICKNNVIELRPVICPTQVTPECPRENAKLIKDKQGCCDIWQCDCECDVFGDPHYTSFGGQTFMFLENCTYILMEERTPNHLLSISVDNYDCEPSASCAKGVIVQYQNNTVKLEVLEGPDDNSILQTTLNQVTIKPPYQAYGLRFDSTEAEVYIYIDEIRSYIFLSIYNRLKINLGMEHFFNNTQGQCGVCGGPSCTRRDGSVEGEECCDKTAYEWIEDDPLKPYCQQARQHVPCYYIYPPTPPPTCAAPLCDLFRNPVFSKCSGEVDVEKLVENCKFDYCVAQINSSVCSPLEHLAAQCKKMGVCVSWRNLTNGICDITCPEGMIFDECQSTTTDFCEGGVRVSGTALDIIRSGCFCPDSQLLAGTHKKICVSECTNCKGPLGEPMPVGAIWESNCHVCTCNNQTLTEECWPKPPLPNPICSAGSALISDCCNNQICVEKTCEYNGTKYKVGETWRDPKSTCLKYHCTSEGTEIEQSVCPQQSCPEEFRVWDEHHCCYSCNITCGVRLSKMTIENCTQEVMLPTCEGNCARRSLWVRSGKELQLENNQFFCREKDYEIKPISLVCGGAPATQYTYKHITSCECQRVV